MPESGLSAVIQGPSEIAGAKDFMEMAMRLNEQKRQSAQQEMVMAGELAKQGLIGEAEFGKVYKNWQKSMGVKLPGEQAPLSKAFGGIGKAVGGIGRAMGIGKQPQAPTTPGQAQAVQALGGAGAQPSGAQASSPVGAQTAKEHPAGGVETTPLKAPSGLDWPMHERFEMIQKQIRSKAETDIARDLREKKLEELKTASMSSDPKVRDAALDILHRTGDVVFNKENEAFFSRTKEDQDKGFKDIFETLTRGESPAQKDERMQKKREFYIQQGLTPEQVEMEVAKPGSSGVKQTPEQLFASARNFELLQRAFGDEAAKKLAPMLARGEPLDLALPNVGETHSQWQQQFDLTKADADRTYELQKKEYELNTKKYGSEEAHRMAEEKRWEVLDQIASDRAQLELNKEEHRELKDNLVSFVSMAKQGKVNQKMVDAIEGRMMNELGMEKKDAGGLIYRMTGGRIGTPPTWGPKLQEETKGALDEAAPEKGGEGFPSMGEIFGTGWLGSMKDVGGAIKKVGTAAGFHAPGAGPTPSSDKMTRGVEMGIKAAGAAGQKLVETDKAARAAIKEMRAHPGSTLMRAAQNIANKLPLTPEQQKVWKQYFKEWQEGVRGEAARTFTSPQ